MRDQPQTGDPHDVAGDATRPGREGCRVDAMPPSGSRARLLDLDEELGQDLTASERRRADQLLVVRIVRVAPGRWHPPDRAEAATLGLLLVAGQLVRHTRYQQRSTAELLGEGDLLRPWDGNEFAPVSISVTMQALSWLTLAVLDRRVEQALAQFPVLHVALTARVLRRTRWMAFQHMLAATPGVQRRLRLLLWGLAQRWGRVRPDGVWLPLQLSHATIGELIGTRRPSVTSSLGVLERRGVLHRQQGGYLLTDPDGLIDPGDAPDSGDDVFAG